MGLENLKSIFTEGMDTFNPPDMQTTSNFNDGVPTLSYSGNFSNLALSSTFPILDTILVQAPFFVSETLLLKYYDDMAFDPRPPKNSGITITNINTYKGTQYIATNPTDFSTAGVGFTTYMPQALPYPRLPFRSTPVLDTLLIQPPFFVSEDLQTKYYEGMAFDPRKPKNEGITINNVNPYMGTRFFATNPTDFGTAGIGDNLYIPYSVPFIPYPETTFDIQSTPDGEGGLVTENVSYPYPWLSLLPSQSPIWGGGDNYINDFVDRLPYPESAFDNNNDMSDGLTLDRLSVPPNGINILNPGQAPILDTLWPNTLPPPQPSYTSDFFVDDVNDPIGDHPFRTNTFDPRTPKNPRVIITKNAYVGTQYVPTNPTDFSTAGDGETSYTPYSVPLKEYPATSFDSNQDDEVYTTTVVDSSVNTLIPGNSPLLDIFWPETRQPPLANDALPYDSDYFVNDIEADMSTHPFLTSTFDPRDAKNSGIQILNINTYTGTRFASLTPNHFATAGIDETAHDSLIDLGKTLEDSDGWNSLYYRYHEPRDAHTEEEQFQPYHYSSNVSRENLSIRYQPNGVGALHILDRTSGLPELSFIEDSLASGDGRTTGKTREPYIVHPIPTKGDLGLNGRLWNMGNREIPIVRALTDTLRLALHFSSTHGIFNILAKNLYTDGFGIQTGVSVDALGRKRSQKTDLEGLHSKSRGSGGLLDLTPTGQPKLRLIQQRYNSSPPYNPIHTLMAVSPLSRNFGIAIGAYNLRSGGNVFGSLTGADGYYEFGSGKVWQSINGTQTKRISLTPRAHKTTVIGDSITLLNPDDETLNYTNADPTNFTSELDESSNYEKGLPLYFIDLRNNKVIYFRGYLDGITENIAPTWAETNYVGRSEPVYVYERAVRDISFNLKLFGHTPAELTRIYQKMNRLTSLCYPEYATDTYLGNQKTKMKPPLVKFRMGELYGSKGKELTGFIKSLTYTVPEESTWEGVQAWDNSKIDVNRVPKFLIATINYQVLHDSVPNMSSLFYGYKTDQPMDTVVESTTTLKMNN